MERLDGSDFEIPSVVLEELKSNVRDLASNYLGTVCFDVIYELLEYELVNAAHVHLLRSRNTPTTQSQIGLMTGVGPESIRRILNSKDSLNHNNPLSVPHRIVFKWCTDSTYLCNKSGKPQKLLISGSGETFQGLINQVTRGLTPQTVINLLSTYQVVSIEEKYWISLNMKNVKSFFNARIMDLIAQDD